jgi:putative iron-regulated protein
MNGNRRHFLYTLGAVPLALAGCGGGGSSGNSAPPVQTFAAKPVVDNLTDAVITQTYRNLNLQAAALLTAVQTLAGAPTEAAMDAAQLAWKSTRVPWESSEGFLFGPVDALGIDPAIDSWPLNTPDLQDFLASNPNATQADIENASDDLRGFHAIEFLLFGDGVNDSDKAVSELTMAEANYLVALAQAFKSRTQALESAWTTSFNGTGAYAAKLKNPAAGGLYASYAAVLQELINGIVGISDEVANAKMAEPLGTSAGTADTSKVESQYSWDSLTDFHNNIQSVLNVYTGKLGFDWTSDTVSAASNGLYAFVAFHDTTLAQRVLNEIVDAQKKIALIKGDGVNTTTAFGGNAKSFRTQLGNEAGRALINAAIAACNTLRNTLDGSVAPLVAKTTFAN